MITARLRRFLWMLAWLSFALSAGAFYTSLALFDGRRPMYTSDALYMVTYLDQWFRGSDVSHYYFSAASFLFPDTLILFALRVLTPNIHLQIVAHSLLQVLLISTALVLIARRAFPDHLLLQVLPLFWMSGLLLAMRPPTGLLAHPVASEMIAPLILNVHHGGSMTISLWSIWLMIIILQRKPNKSRHTGGILALVVLFLINGFTVQSDFLHIAQFILPALASLIVLFLMGRLLIAQVLGLSAILIGALGFGVLTLRTGAVFFHLSFDRVNLDAVRVFQDQLGQIFSAYPGIPILGGAYLILGLIALFGALRAPRRKSITISADSAGLFTFLWLSASAASVTAAGLLSWNLRTRYYAFVLIILIAVGWTFLLGRFRFFVNATQPRPFWVGIGALVMIAWGASDWSRISAWNAYGDYYPDDVRCLDENAVRLGLQGGIADYWLVKHGMILSRQGLHFAQVHNELLPYLWINDPEWYNHRFDFVILNEDGIDDDITEEMVRRRFGEPAGTFICPDERNQGVMTIWYYNRPEDAPVWNYMRTRPALAMILHGARRVTFTADDLLLLRGKRTPDHYALVTASDGVGAFTFGPYAYLPADNYRYQIHYRTDTPNAARYEILPFLHKPVASGELSTGESVVSGTFTLTQALSIEVQIIFWGQGELEIKQIILERVSP